MAKPPDLESPVFVPLLAKRANWLAALFRTRGKAMTQGGSNWNVVPRDGGRRKGRGDNSSISFQAADAVPDRRLAPAHHANQVPERESSNGSISQGRAALEVRCSISRGYWGTQYGVAQVAEARLAAPAALTTNYRNGV